MKDRLQNCIEYLIESRRIASTADLSRVLGKPKSYMSEMLSGKKVISEHFVRTFVNYFPEISVQWLLYGTGEMLELNSIYKRINAVLSLEGITKREFEKGANTFSYIFPGIYRNAENNPGDIKVAAGWIDCLINLFPKYSEEWLKYGTGEMITSESSLGAKCFHKTEESTTTRPNMQRIPLYNQSAAAGLSSEACKTTIADEYICIPKLNTVDGAIYVRGESMAPLLQPGDIVIYHKLDTNLNSILWGQLYLLTFEMTERNSYTMIGYIQQSDSVELIRIISENKRFQPKDIPIKSIKTLAIIKSSISYHTF